MLPREGHLKAAKIILTYLKKNPKGSIIDDRTYPNHSTYTIKSHPNWKDFYPDAEEEITSC
jgi:hypothetical protein